jgi:serine/threonine protein phosphatase 1
MRTLILGDCHGRYKALQQVLQRSNFNYEEDRLIFLGDICDRGEEPFDCIKEILQIRNRILIMGNHDQNFSHFINTNVDMFNGHNGFFGTRMLWMNADEETRMFTKAFFKEMRFYFIDEKKNMYTHGGFDRMEPVERQDEYSFCWDRSLWEKAKCVRGEGAKLNTVDGFNEIFIGHTPTIIDFNPDNSRITLPLNYGGVWNLDTGAGFSAGRLTLMDRDTHEYWQSDFNHQLYPDK